MGTVGHNLQGQGGPDPRTLVQVVHLRKLLGHTENKNFVEALVLLTSYPPHRLVNIRLAVLLSPHEVEGVVEMHRNAFRGRLGVLGGHASCVPRHGSCLPFHYSNILSKDVALRHC